jgi:hypothetical protein
MTRRSLGRRIESLLKRVAEHETKVQMEETKDEPDQGTHQALEGRDIGLWQNIERASITHLRIQAEALEEGLEEAMAA